MANADTLPRLRFAKPPDLGNACRPLDRVEVLDTEDQRVGTFDGLVLETASDRPLYLVIQEAGPNDSRHLVPVGSAWFDQTARAIRVDRADAAVGWPRFTPGEFERMSTDDVARYERKVLTTCCPEVLLRDGTPEYGDAATFRCPDWLARRD